MALMGYTLASTVFGLILYAYLIGVELHLASDRLARAPERFTPLRLDESITREIRARAKAFDAARRAGKDMTLRIGNDQINQRFAATTDPGTYQDRIRLRMRDDIMTVKLSLPMDERGFPGRFFNGELELEAAYDEDGLQLDLREVLLGEAPLPPRLMDLLRVAAFALRFLPPDARHRKLRGLGRFNIQDSEFVTRSTH